MLSQKILLLILCVLFVSGVAAQDTSGIKKGNAEEQLRHQKQKKELEFIDADGDGYNDNAPDHDGDGIPNALDPDYQALKQQKEFVDLDGDGINDNLIREQIRRQQSGIGPKPKSGSQNLAPREGRGEKKQQKKSGKN